MLFRTNADGSLVVVPEFKPEKTIAETIPANGSIEVRVAGMSYFKIVKKAGTLTTELNSDGNAVDIEEYAINDTIEKIKITDTSGSDNAVVIFRA